MTPRPEDGNEVRRTLASLSISFALAWVTVSMVAGPGSAALVALVGDLSWSGAFIGLFYASAAIGAATLGRAMDRYGRKPGLVAAHAISAAGYLIAGVGASVGSLAWFASGTVLLAFGFGGVNLSRVAAAEIFPPAQRGRAVAWIQLSATAGAIVGPLLLLLSGPLGSWLGRPPLSLVWFLAPPLLLAGGVIVARAAEPMTLAARVAKDAQAARASTDPKPRPFVFVAGSVALAAALAAMASVMGVAGAAVHHAGHGTSVLGIIMLFHFVGMFGLSRVVGRVADAFGRRTTILLGLGTIAAGGGVVAMDAGAWGFGAGLLVVGIGWNFAFIGATVLLTDVSPPARRARLMGRADLAAQSVAALVALGGGLWFAQRGVAGLGIVAIVVAAAPVALLAFVRERAPADYGVEPQLAHAPAVEEA